MWSEQGMTEKTIEIVVGTVVFLTALIFLFFVLNVTNFKEDASNYNLTASFRSAEGISVGTDVRMAGVKIGAVTNLALNKDSYKADAMISISEEINIPDDSSILISSEGLLGGSFVEIVPGGSMSNYETGEEVTDTQSSISLVSLLLRMFSGSKE